MPNESVVPHLPPLSRGRDACEYLRSVGLSPKTPCIRSSDVNYLDKPFVYYLERRLGMSSVFNKSDSSAHGDWGHIRANLTGSSEKIKAGMEMAFKTWAGQVSVQANALGMGEGAIAAFITNERQRWQESWVWYEAAASLRLERTLPGGLPSLHNEREWQILGRELIVAFVHDLFPDVRIVAQFDDLAYNKVTRELFIDDYKFTSGSRVQRVKSCPVEYQTWTYLTVLQGALPEIIKKFGLPADTKVGGMRHIVIATPNLSMGMKDRKYQWKSEGKRSGRQGIVRLKDEGWVFISSNGESVTYADEGDAVRALHGFTGKQPEKEFAGEPDPAMYRHRIDQWYRGVGEFSARAIEYDTDPQIVVSTTHPSVLDNEMKQEYYDLTGQIYSLAMRDPYPHNYPRTQNGMRNKFSISESVYADFHVLPVQEWPRLMRENLLVVKPREKDYWSAASTGLLE